MYSGDKNTFDFVMNQLMRTLGVKLKKKVKKRTHRAKSRGDLKMSSIGHHSSISRADFEMDTNS